jgi:hypothetical protein
MTTFFGGVDMSRRRGLEALTDSELVQFFEAARRAERASVEDAFHMNADFAAEIDRRVFELYETESR